MEIITLTREQYLADIQEAARIGATIALKSGISGDEWLTMEQAMDVVKIKSTSGFRAYRRKHSLYGKEKVQTSGNRKLFNKKHLL